MFLHRIIHLIMCIVGTVVIQLTWWTDIEKNEYVDFIVIFAYFGDGMILIILTIAQCLGEMSPFTDILFCIFNLVVHFSTSVVLLPKIRDATLLYTLSTAIAITSVLELILVNVVKYTQQKTELPE